MSYNLALIKRAKFVSENLDSNSKFITIKHYPFQEWARVELTDFITAYGGTFNSEIKLTKELLNKILDDEREKRSQDVFRTTRSHLWSLRVECNWFNLLFYDYYLYVG